jgi:hypothetical protein
MVTFYKVDLIHRLQTFPEITKGSLETARLLHLKNVVTPFISVPHHNFSGQINNYVLVAIATSFKRRRNLKATLPISCSKKTPLTYRS